MSGPQELLKFEFILLTYGLVGDKGLVIKAENLGDVVEIGMLSHEGPLRIVHSIIEISNGNFDAPVILVVDLNMPMHAYWAHMVCALQ